MSIVLVIFLITISGTTILDKFYYWYCEKLGIKVEKPEGF
jgi:hypothetical protein